jgi:hypothetical protein
MNSLVLRWKLPETRLALLINIVIKKFTSKNSLRIEEVSTINQPQKFIVIIIIITIIILLYNNTIKIIIHMHYIFYNMHTLHIICNI